MSLKPKHAISKDILIAAKFQGKEFENPSENKRRNFKEKRKKKRQQTTRCILMTAEEETPHFLQPLFNYSPFNRTHRERLEERIVTQRIL